MARQGIDFQRVSFAYDNMEQLLISELTTCFPVGWTGIVGANGTGKTTILKLAVGDLEADDGSVLAPGDAIYCAQRTDENPALLEELIHSWDGLACELRGRLGVNPEWPERWATLSHGERKRAQIAVALWQQPQALAIDEPTNHIDRDARDMLASALEAYPGIGLLVSHDRDLLDGLCRQCLFVEPPQAIMRPGGYTKGTEQAVIDEESTKREYDRARREHEKLKRESIRRREAASRSHRQRSKRGLAIKDHDARFKRNLARVTGKDGVGGKLLNQMDGRLAQAQDRLDSIEVRKRYEMGIWMPGEKSKRKVLLRIAAGSLELGESRSLAFPELSVLADDRIALTGRNGCGKSTLVEWIVSSLDLPAERLVYVPQEIPLEASQTIMEEARHLPGDRLGQMMTVVSRLGSRPQRILASSEPSPGEIRKVLLATGIANRPLVVIMDEPTNHLDLPSIECLESALVGCPCALLLVSHDRRFLERLTTRRWDVEDHPEVSGDSLLRPVP